MRAAIEGFAIAALVCGHGILFAAIGGGFRRHRRQAPAHLSPSDRRRGALIIAPIVLVPVGGALLAWVLTRTAAWLFVAEFGGLAFVSVTMMLVLVPLAMLREGRASRG